MMKKYIMPEVSVCVLNDEDVITTSTITVQPYGGDAIVFDWDDLGLQ